MAAGAHFGCPKFTFDVISGHFRSIGHFGCLKFTFDSNSGHFRSIQNFFFFRWPFWMSENNFKSHFWPFQIDDILDGTTMSIIELVKSYRADNEIVMRQRWRTRRRRTWLGGCRGYFRDA